MTKFPLQTADEGAAVEAIDLGEKIPIGPSKGGAAAGLATEGRAVPEWSDKLAQNILAGSFTLPLKVGLLINCTFMVVTE